MSKRMFVASLNSCIGEDVVIKGWIYRLRVLPKTTFLILKDCSGTVQCVAGPDTLKELHLKIDDVVAIKGHVRSEPRSKVGFEVDILDVTILNRSAYDLPFNSSSDISSVGPDVILEHRPLSIRHEKYNDVFLIQAAIVHYYREFLLINRFTEIFTSKIVSSGTEGGTNLFEIKYFDRIAYLAQSPQFFKEHGVCALERVFETGHVYRAEPHATSRHLTEYYSLDLEMGFIDGPEEVIQLEKEMLTYIFDKLNVHYPEIIKRNQKELLPSMMNVPTWEFADCLEKLKNNYHRTDLIDDLDPEGERQLCELAKKETGVSAVFVIGYPADGRPFYVYPRNQKGDAQSFDLLFQGIEITIGGQRLHKREDLEKALQHRGLDPISFKDHLRMFELGMPPHGGLAIGLERLTSQIMGLANVREATMYPRDKFKISP